ncbi:MAG: endonuclease/exonuclease/phosphatase family protein [Oscillospiraceae bacterium]|nr:endonuclease/exonuclease/phosphatase family protein [Oscillospiraceae bacterium]
MKKCKHPKRRKVFGIIGIVVAAVIVAALIVMFWHYPGFVSKKEAINVSPSAAEIKMMSCNLRCLTPLDRGEKSWYYRADLILDDIAAGAPGIIGFQEATKWQYKYLVDTMPQYDSIITYRDSSIIAEGCPIFYNTQLYSLVDKGSFWLSETPDVMSKDWGAACYRICSYAILTDNASGQNFVVFNTHLDHVSDEARINGIAVVLDKIEAFGSLPAVIMGDLNAEEGSATYISATENFLDARYEAAETTDSYTYQNWGNMEKACRIDYFMVSKTGFNVHSYAVVDNVHDGVYASDHCPIVMTVTME